MPTEHVVTTGVYAGQRHSKATPDRYCPLQFTPGITIHLADGENRMGHYSMYKLTFEQVFILPLTNTADSNNDETSKNSTRNILNN